MTRIFPPLASSKLLGGKINSSFRTSFPVSISHTLENPGKSTQIMYSSGIITSFLVCSPHENIPPINMQNYKAVPFPRNISQSFYSLLSYKHIISFVSIFTIILSLLPLMLSKIFPRQKKVVDTGQ